MKPARAARPASAQKRLVWTDDNRTAYPWPDGRTELVMMNDPARGVVARFGSGMP